MQDKQFQTLQLKSSMKFLLFFTKKDAIYLALTLALFCGTLVPMILGALDFTFYPTAVQTHTSVSIVGYLSFGTLLALPILTETEDAIKWKYLRSKI